ncbi:zinc ribbon domain-containing protein [Pseudoalteromonas umbrosa]|uniref:zinc ribbon domain-containing protein n=1 Tax=Pseudoalteromonas umbrosa TaxID=3048489 RepID=UPI0024C3D469|nr:zinc ribbon domain-containing protein [Pseudoalteromonas sp. B95]MDK1287690.1 zinc ribbon domain-containing protein [Pseudoalteromonas sp. B95]
MLLVKCKKCGETISAKVKSCSKCGAKISKGTSFFKWSGLIVIVIVIYILSQVPISGVNKLDVVATLSSFINASKVAYIELRDKTIYKKPAWNTSTSRDLMTGRWSAYATSPITKSNKRLSFPYSDVEAWIGVGCNAESKWSYIAFNTAPTLQKTRTGVIKASVKWDDNIEDITLIQNSGAKFLHFQNDSKIITKLKSSETALLELQWSAEQRVYFNFTLNGAFKAITKAYQKCFD